MSHQFNDLTVGLHRVPVTDNSSRAPCKESSDERTASTAGFGDGDSVYSSVLSNQRRTSSAAGSLSTSPSDDTAANAGGTESSSKINMDKVLPNEEPVDRQMPAIQIGRNTMRTISQYLRPPKVNACDWQDMAEEMGFNYQIEIKNFELQPDPVGCVLASWNTKHGSTVGKLLDILEKIERFDVLEALPPLLAVDCERWKRRQEEMLDPVQVPEVSGSHPIMHLPPGDMRGITLGDNSSGPPEMFDAYVCSADADLDFVRELIKQMESPPHNFKLCLDIRDLVPGGSHALVTAELIQNRCRKMLVVLSPEFLMSSDCDFQTKFAVSLEPGARSKRIIPILVRPCRLPAIIRHITACDFTKQDLRPWLWDRLRKAISLR